MPVDVQRLFGVLLDELAAHRPLRSLWPARLSDRAEVLLYFSHMKVYRGWSGAEVRKRSRGGVYPLNRAQLAEEGNLFDLRSMPSTFHLQKRMRDSAAGWTGRAGSRAGGFDVSGDCAHTP